jgi:hypothetical protein
LGTGSLGFLASLLPMTRDRVWDNDQKHAFWRETVKTYFPKFGVSWREVA